MAIKEGQKAPAFSLQDQTGKTHRLVDYKGKWVLLYFYPKDFTPGCTAEACSLRDHQKAFASTKTVILGVSADSVESHEKFATKYNLPFPILSDSDKKIATAYGVVGKKSLFGRSFLGVKRMSFLINPEGNIEKIYAKVRPDEHAEEVLTDRKQ